MFCEVTVTLDYQTGSPLNPRWHLCQIWRISLKDILRYHVHIHGTNGQTFTFCCLTVIARVVTMYFHSLFKIFSSHRDRHTLCTEASCKQTQWGKRAWCHWAEIGRCWVLGTGGRAESGKKGKSLCKRTDITHAGALQSSSSLLSLVCNHGNKDKATASLLIACLSSHSTEPHFYILLHYIEARPHNSNYELNSKEINTHSNYSTSSLIGRVITNQLTTYLYSNN